MCGACAALVLGHIDRGVAGTTPRQRDAKLHRDGEEQRAKAKPQQFELDLLFRA